MPKWHSEYYPQIHQERFHESNARYKWFMGGVGSGKTIAGVHEIAFLADDNPNCDGVIASLTYPMLRDVILPMWQEWIHPSLYEYKRGDQLILWHTGRKIFLRSATDPDRASGLNVGFGWLDEGALLLKDKFWKILQARVRQQAKRPCLFVTSTPNGMNWLAKFFRTAPDTFIARCRTSDNKQLPSDFEASLRASYGDEYAAQYLDAMILDLQGLVWPIIYRMHCSLTPEEMLKRCKHKFGGVDWGFTAPAALVAGGIDYDGRWYLFDEWYRRGQDRDVVADAAREMTSKWGIQQWYSDHDPEGISHMTRRGMNCIPAEKDVVAGIQHVRTLLAPRSDGQPRMFIGSWLKNWLREQEAYQFPEEKEEPLGLNGDHLMDATRYMAYTHSLTWAPMGGFESIGANRINRDNRDWSSY